MNSAKFEEISLLVRSAEVSLFIGSGFSLKAGAPSASYLVNSLARLFPKGYKKGLRYLPLDDIASEYVKLCQGNREPLMEFLREKETVDEFKDYIVYHRNCKSERVAPKPAFKIGTLNAHQSGIDITFEDNSNMKDPAYRASALIRCFKVKDLKDGEWVDREFAKPKDKTRPTVEAYPLHLYEYLFMKQVLTDVCVKWVDTPVTEESLHTGPRVNVHKYDSSGNRKKEWDLRERAYSIEPFK